MLKMTNHSPTADHNICGSTIEQLSSAALTLFRVASRRSEGGYTLVALLAMMTVVALFAMAVAPSVQQQAQREREQEAIFRGEQVADAIRDYYRYRSSISQLPAIKHCQRRWTNCCREYRFRVDRRTVRFCVASAARDPLTIEGEWRFVLPRTEALIDFQQSVMFYAGNVLPPPRDPQMAQLQQFAVPQHHQRHQSRARLRNARARHRSTMMRVVHSSV